MTKIAAGMIYLYSLLESGLDLSTRRNINRNIPTPRVIKVSPKIYLTQLEPLFYFCGEFGRMFKFCGRSLVIALKHYIFSFKLIGNFEARTASNSLIFYESGFSSPKQLAIFLRV